MTDTLKNGFRISTFQDCLVIDPVGFYDNFIMATDGSKNLYNFVKEIIAQTEVKDIHSNLKYIIIDCSIESMAVFNDEKIESPSRFITELAQEYEKEDYVFICLTGNYHAERNHKMWCAFNNVDVPNSHVMHRDMLAWHQLSNQPPLNNKKDNPRYLATLLNRKPQYHRGLMLQGLHKKNILDRIKVTFPFVGDASKDSNLSGQMDFLDEDVRDILPIPLAEGGVDSTEWIQYEWRHKMQEYESFLDCFRDSYFDIVSETFDGDFVSRNYDFNRVNYPFKQTFVTEKTWRCFHWKRPFILNAEEDSIKHLHDLGFKTFENFWDESYAGYGDVENRIDAIAEVVSELSKLGEWDLYNMFNSGEMQNILEHNWLQYQKYAGSQHINKWIQSNIPVVEKHSELSLKVNENFPSANFITTILEQDEDEFLVIKPKHVLNFMSNDPQDELLNIIRVLGVNKRIVFDQSLEAIENYEGHIESPYHLLHNVMQRCSLNELIYIDGNGKTQDNYNNWCSKHNQEPKLTVRYIHIFAKLQSDLQPQVTADYSTPMDKIINCMNMRPKKHRAEVLKELYTHDGLNNEKTVWSWHTNKNGSWNEEWFEGEQFEPLRNILPHDGPDELLNVRNNWHQWQPNLNKKLYKFTDIFLNSYIDIISESHSNCDNTNGFLVQFPTEKTFRSLNYGKAFVINGPKNSLQHLRNQGFATFGDFWSEEYDEWGNAERIQKMIQAILPFIRGNISPYETFSGVRMQEVLLHNQRHFEAYAQQQSVQYILEHGLDNQPSYGKHIKLY